MPKRPKPSKAEKLNRAIERWQQKQEGAVIMLRKSAEMLAKLHRQRRRMLATIPRPPRDLDQIPAVQEIIEAAMPTSASKGDDDGGIPEFLRRGQAAQDAVDAEVDKANRRLQAMADPRTKEKRAERRAVEREKREADLRGKTRKMPLTGKAALDAIKSGC